MVEAAPGIALDRQAGGLDGGDDFLGGFATTAGRVTQGVEFLREAPKVVDCFRAVGKTDRRQRRIPVRADDDDGARQRQGAGCGSDRRTGRAGAQGKGRRAMRDEEGWLGWSHANDS